jgi:hypothetical protein
MMFVDMVMGGRLAKCQNPALRPVFLKPHGVAAATTWNCSKLWTDCAEKNGIQEQKIGR